MRISLKQVRQHPEFKGLPKEIQSLTNSSQISWHLRTGKHSFPVCCGCKKNPTRWDQNTKSYRQFCSSKCTGKSEKVLQKRRRSWKDSGGHPMQCQESLAKRRATMEERYGKDPWQEVLRKSRATTKKRYGVEYSHQCPEVRQKFLNTMKEKYGTEYAMQSSELKKRHAESSMRSLGVSSPLASFEVRERAKETMTEKYGAEHAMQNAGLFHKAQSSMARLKKYKFPSGRTEHVQGFEPFALDWLLLKEDIDEQDICVGTKVPEINWTDKQGNKRKHYPDIYVRSQNRIVEVKSYYTIPCLDSLLLKKIAAEQAGYSYHVYIFDASGNLVETIDREDTA